MISPALASLAALGAAFTWGLGSLLFARALTRPASGGVPPPPAAVNLFKNALALAVFCAWALLARVSWPPAAVWPWLLASGAFGFALGDALYFAALQRIGVQKSAMLAELNVPFTACLAFVFAGERFGAWLLGGMAIVLLGVTIVVREQLPGEPRSPGVWRGGVACALGAVLFQSLAAVLGHHGFADVEVLPGMIVRMLGGTLAAVLLAPAAGLAQGSGARVELGRLFAPFAERALWPALGLAALSGSIVGLPLFHLALRELETGRAMVLLATTPLFTLPLARLFGERHGARAWVGTCIGFAGVLAVVWALEPGP